MKRTKRREKSTDLDISPLIDMVFILLIFFMVSTTFVKDAEIELKRPSASSASTASTKSLRVQIDRNGAIFFDGNPIKPWMIQTKARDFFRGGGDKNVLVVADRGNSVERLVDVVDQLKLAGAETVSVATDKELGGG